MIRIITAEGTFDIPGAVTDVDTSGDLKIRRKGQTIAQFRRWIHWHEVPEVTNE